MKMQPGDWIAKEDIRDAEHLKRIREAVRAQGWRVENRWSEWEMHFWNECWRTVKLDEDGDLVWAHPDACPGRRIDPTELLSGKRKGHPAAPLLRELAEVAEWHPEPWREFEGWNRISELWTPCRDMAEAAERASCSKLRRRPRTKKIGAYDVPLPMREALAYRDSYYVADPAAQSFCVLSVWQCDDYDRFRLERGLIHLDPESAATHGRALASLMQEDEG